MKGLLICSWTILLFISIAYSYPIRGNMLLTRSNSLGKRNGTTLFAGAAEFRLLIQGTKNAYTTVRGGDILTYRLDKEINGKSIGLGVFGSDDKLYPLCNRVEMGSEFFIDNTSAPLSIELLRKNNQLLRVISSDRRGEAFLIEEYLDSMIHVPVIDGSLASSSLTPPISEEDEIQSTLEQISGLNKKLAQLLTMSRGGASKNNSKQVVTSSAAPKPVGPYSQAIKSNGVLYVSGCIGLDPTTGKLVSDDLREQTAQALKNLQEILRAGHSDCKSINKVTIFTTDLKQFSVINSVYADFLKENIVTECPARSTVEVSALPLGAKFEIEAIANYHSDNDQ